MSRASVRAPRPLGGRLAQRASGGSLPAAPTARRPLGGRLAQRAPRGCRPSPGFTLIEILVALAVVAVALAAGMRTLAQSADGAGTLKARTLAMWVAQNRLAAAELARELPAAGRRSGEATQAGTAFVWRESVGGTPNPAFRRIEIDVAEARSPDYVLARLTGYVAGSERR